MGNNSTWNKIWKICIIRALFDPPSEQVIFSILFLRFKSRHYLEFSALSGQFNFQHCLWLFLGSWRKHQTEELMWYHSAFIAFCDIFRIRKITVWEPHHFTLLPILRIGNNQTSQMNTPNRHWKCRWGGKKVLQIWFISCCINYWARGFLFLQNL